MDEITAVMERREKEPKSVEFVRVGCMDENDRPGKNVVKIGIAGSGVTVEGGDNNSYSNDERENMSEVFPYIAEWVGVFSRHCKTKCGISSHPDCAAVGIQGKSSDEDLVDVTKHLSVAHNLDYAGHLAVSNWPRKLRNGVSSWFNRTKGQPHKASSINITVGGGITGLEKDKVEKKSGGSAFDISMDWVNHALNRGLSREKIEKVLLFQLKLAYSISVNVRNNKNPFNIFDGGRLDYETTDENMNVVKEIINIARDEISQGHWEAALHH